MDDIEPRRFFPFITGRYTISPGLSPLRDEPVFLIDRDYERTCDLKRELLEKDHAKHVQFHDFPAELERPVVETLAAGLCREYPAKASRDGALLSIADARIELESSGAFDALARRVQEDLAVVRIVDQRDFNAAIHLCFANGWSPSEKIGKSFFETHAPVAGIEAINARAFEWARLMVNARNPLVRFVWGIRFDDWLDHHPESPARSWDSEAPEVWVRVERQTIIGLPELSAAIFLIRTYLYSATSLSEAEREQLAQAIESMSEASAEYKGIAANRREIVDFLRGQGLQE